MSHKFLLDASFHALLFSIDQELADSAKQQGCLHCGGRLDQANYPRSPMGLLPSLRTHYTKRMSFCCATCRKRVTPASVRFFGRRWYPAPLLLLICILKFGINECRLAQVKRHLEVVVTMSTWKRWRRWWREFFMATAFWQANQSLVVTAMDKNAGVSDICRGKKYT